MSSAVMDETALTDRECAILQFIEGFILQYGFPPSLREIMDGIEISSTSVASYTIRRLEDKGVLELQPKTSRGIRLLTSSYQPDENAMVSVPLLRRIIPIPELGIPHSNKKLAVPINWIAGAPIKDVYAVEMYSERLYDALVNPGDVVVLQNTACAASGDTVMAIIHPDKELRIRRIYHEGDEARLEPLLKQLQPRLVPPQDVHIIGKVLGMLRQF
jgi:repressor LexA